ncbi:MAG: PAS domain S-box protein [Verrucomicrobia bacterium]|nr:PAS domain S-box protein [Verrucomicrobiota bacterium]
MTDKFKYLALTVFLSLIVILSGYLYVTKKTNSFRNERSLDLKVVSEMESRILSDWYKDELSDAGFIAQDTLLYNLITEYPEGDQDIDNSTLSYYLNSLVVSHDLSSIILTSPDSELIYCTDTNLNALDSTLRANIQKAVINNHAISSDLYYNSSNEYICIDFIAPILNDNNTPIAAIVFRVDPRDSLYPLIESWQMPHETSEVLIVKQDDDHVLFLNELRFSEHESLDLRIPLTEKEVPAVQAVLGYEGIWEGKDYRGVDVLAYVQAVPDTSWYMISKIDKNEIYEQLYTQNNYIIVLIILLIVSITIGVAFFYSYRQHNIYRSLWQSQEEFKTTLQSIGDGVITTDKSGVVTYLNPIAEKLTGWRASEATRNELGTVFNIINEDTRAKTENPVARVLKHGLIVGLANHTLLISKDGKEIPIADSAAPIRSRDGEIIGVVLVFRDQTEERNQQKTIEESRRQLQTLMSNLPGMAYRCKNDPDWTMEFVSDGCLELTGYAADELEDNRIISYAETIHPDDRERVDDSVQNGVSTHAHFEMEYRIITKHGRTKWVWERGQCVDLGNDGSAKLEGFITDITQRKYAVDELRSLKDVLELKIKEQTRSLHEKIAELERFHDATVDRELRMKELQDEINRLKGYS